MTITPKYQFYAEECLRWAEETDDDQNRQAFLDMAVVWLHLASREKSVQRPAQKVPLDQRPHVAERRQPP